MTNGWASNPPGDGRLWAFGPTLGSPIFTLDLDRPNAGGPALGGQGELVIADRQGLYAYRRPGPTAACVARNGSGVNPATYTCSSPPAIYGTFAAEVSTTPDSALTALVFSLGAPAAPVPLGGQELLIDVPFALLDVRPIRDGGIHEFALPGHPTLLGATLATQAGRVELLGGVPVVELANAPDLTFGY